MKLIINGVEIDPTRIKKRVRLSNLNFNSTKYRKAQNPISHYEMYQYITCMA